MWRDHATTCQQPKVLDDVDANSFGSNSLSTVPVPNPDALGEFRVSTSMYDASQGRGSGGNINVVRKVWERTNTFHGGLFEYYRSNDMNASNRRFSNAAGKIPVPVLHAEPVWRSGGRADSQA